MALSHLSQFAPTLNFFYPNLNLVNSLIIPGCLLGYGFFWWFIYAHSGRFFNLPKVEEMAFFMPKTAREIMGEREFTRRLLELDQGLRIQP